MRCNDDTFLRGLYCVFRKDVPETNGAPKVNITILWNFWHIRPLARVKWQKRPPPEWNGKTTVAARSPGDTCRVPPRTEAACAATESASSSERKTGSCGPCRLCRWRHADVERAASVGGGTLTWQPHAGFPRYCRDCRQTARSSERGDCALISTRRKHQTISQMLLSHSLYDMQMLLFAAQLTPLPLLSSLLLCRCSLLS